MSGIVRYSAEFERIKALPRRKWSETDALALAKEYTRILKTTDGKMELKPHQAIALHELREKKGLFTPLIVGGGKTLISLLAPMVLPSAAHPMLLIPATLKEKTAIEQSELGKHFKMPTNLRVVTYQSLGVLSGQHILEDGLVVPKLIIADEAHFLKNPKAAVTRRVARFLKKYPETVFIAMSGTVMRNSLHDFAALLRWGLADSAPIPLEYEELNEWADALDERTGFRAASRLSPGPLVHLSPGFEENRTWQDDDIDIARRAFRSRLEETPGVVIMPGGQTGCSIYLSKIYTGCNQKTEENFDVLRNSWSTPDGWTFTEAMQIWMYARQLALGFHGIWDPRPPDAWMERRQKWHAFVRETISHSHHLDSEKAVAEACERGELKNAGEYSLWREIRDTYRINTRDIWHDDTALLAAEKWISEKKNGVVWTSHVFFARELAKRTGLMYFGENGICEETGQDITTYPQKGVVILSLQANKAGRNLQGWHKCLVTSPPMSNLEFEQLIGRFDRTGQMNDTVEVDVLVGCVENEDGLERAFREAKATHDLLGYNQKLLLADMVQSNTEANRMPSSYRYRKVKGQSIKVQQ